MTAFFDNLLINYFNCVIPKKFDIFRYVYKKNV